MRPRARVRVALVLGANTMCTKMRYRVQDLRTGKVYIQGDNAEYENLQNVKSLKIVERIPCGNCIECRIQHSAEWATRCIWETKEHEENIMLTLTYDDEHIPKGQRIDKETGEVFETLTLKRKDLQDFKKRLRKKYKHIKLKTFEAGEYGSEEEYIDNYGRKRKGTRRPHYHMIVFGLTPEDMRFHKWSKCEWSKKKNALFKSKTIDKLWGMGHADLNEVNYETCAYVARYVVKKYKGSDSKEHYEEMGIAPEFQGQSQGIGKAYFEKNKEKIFNQEAFWQVTKKGLKRVKLPRYFDKLIEKEDPEHFKKIVEERRHRSYQNWEDILSKTSISKTEYINNQDNKSKNKYKKLSRTLT